MFPLLLLGILGLALASRRGGSSSSKPPSSSAKPGETAAQRIVRETKDIIDGKRDAYTDDPEDVQAELERARKAVALAKQKEAQTKPPASSSSSTPRPPTVSVGPITQTKPAAAAKKPAPAGTDLALAKSTAAKMAAYLKQAGRDRYDRKALKLWQTRAGLAPDGIYGKGTAAALKYFGAPGPAPFFNQGTPTYTPPA